MLKVEKVSYSYGKNTVLKDISFFVEEGEILGILGPNGGGKSTLLKILTGELKPKSGTVSFSHKTIGYVPQETKLNHSFPLKVREIFELYSNQNPELLIEKFDIKESLNSFFHELSGGQKKRVQIISSLLEKPKFLILDEPTAGLDGAGQDQLLTHIKDYSKENLTCVIVVDHNINEIIQRSDKILCLNKSSHWHEKSELLTKDVLKSIYHCEFEHLLLHHKNQDHLEQEHKFCSHDHSKDGEES